MHTLKSFFAFLLVWLFGSSSFAQSSAAFQSLFYPRSLTSAGLGEQGAASKSANDAMQYNPANLVYADGVEFSFFRNPWNSFGWPLPLTSLSVGGKLGNGGSVGVEYTDWDWGDLSVLTVQNPEGGGKFHAYERSLAAGYAMSFGDEFVIGAEMRYAWKALPPLETLDHVLFSAGISYTPFVLSNRLHTGLSFMNFGTAIEYEGTLYDFVSGTSQKHVFLLPPPAQMNLGIEALVVSDKFFDISLSLGATKPLVKRNDDDGQSSFKSLFNDWTDFPEDVTARIGLGCIWHPLYLGGGVSFFQDMYVGYFTIGPKEGQINYYTHGFRVGLKAYGISATIGYAGEWHKSIDISSYLPMEFPWETFQVGLSTDLSLFGKEEEKPESSLHGIVLSGGYSYGVVTGKMKEAAVDGATLSFSNDALWSAEADFYINENSAILSSIHYSRMTETLRVASFPVPFFPSPFVMDLGIETVSLESGFRYHPIDAFHPFFVQASLGVIRLNPVYEHTSPRYYYNTFDRLVVGCIVRVGDIGIIVMPKVGLTTIFMKEYENGSRLGGYNQFEFGMNAGYEM